MRDAPLHQTIADLSASLEMTILFIFPETPDQIRVSAWPHSATLGDAPKTLEDVLLLLKDAENRRHQFGQWLKQKAPRSPLSFSFQKIDRNLSRFNFELRAADFPDGENNAVVLRIQDTTRENGLMREVENLGRLASAGQIAAGVAHEFNNILTAMLGWTQIAQHAASDNPGALSALATIEQNMMRAKEIAGEILGMSRPENHSLKATDVVSIVEEALDLLSLELNTANIEITRSFPGEAFCKVDPTRLVQVFINVIRNALDATPPHGTLAVTVSPRDNVVDIRFSDTGSGISDEVIDRIFTPFFTTKTASDPGVHGGSGLGLSICRKIIEEYGGVISVSSQKPGGTTVTITLPATAEGGLASEPLPDSTASFPPGISVLVMDDEPDICEMIHTALTLRGAHVVQATNGAQALQLCRENLFNVAFLDFSMAGLSGHELSAAIAEAQPALPLVLMSGADIPFDVNASHSNFLKKPFDLHEIQAKLHEILQQHS